VPPLPQRPYPEILRDLEALKEHLTNLGLRWIPDRLCEAIANIKELEQIRRENRLKDLISPNNPQRTAACASWFGHLSKASS
jgi:hypothetical protein